MYKKMAAALKSSKSFITTPIFYVNAGEYAHTDDQVCRRFFTYSTHSLHIGC